MILWVICIVCGAIILALILYIITIQLSLRELNEQLSFISKNITNMSLAPASGSRQIRKLVESINGFFVSFRERELETIRKDDAIKETITNMSHDVRTPLTSLKGYFELMCQTDSEEDKQKYKGIIVERIDTLADLLEDLFTFSKISSTNYKIKLDKIDASQTFVTTILSFYDDFENQGFKTEIDIEEGIYILSEEQSLKRVIQNLLKNCLVHGHKNVEFSLKRSSDKKAIITISNEIREGEEVDISRVFERFYKGDKARHVNSSGIGLSVTRKLVSLMNGDIDAHVNGRQFVITLTFEMI